MTASERPGAGELGSGGVCPDARRAMLALEHARDARRDGEARLRELRERDIAEAERAFEHATRSARRKLEQATEAIESRFRTRSDEFEQRAATERAALERTHRSRSEEVQEHAGAALHKLRDRLREELWLIETVFDADDRQSRSAHEKASESVKALRERLDSAEQEADSHWRFYETPRPTPEPAGPVEAASIGDAESMVAESESAVAALGSLKTPQFSQRWALITLAVAMGVAGLIGGLAASEWELGALAYAGGVLGAGAGVGAWFMIRSISRKAVAARGQAASTALSRARAATDVVMAEADRRRQETLERIRDKRDSEAGSLKSKAGERERALVASREEKLGIIAREHEAASASLEARLERDSREIRAEYERAASEATREYEHATREVTAAHESRMDELRAEERRIREGMELDRDRFLADARRDLEALTGLSSAIAPDWAEIERVSAKVDDRHWVRIGSVTFDRGEDQDDAAPDPSPPSAPLGIDLADGRGGLLLEHAGPGRARALSALRAATVRVLTTIPPGKARLTVIDPVGLGQSFAGLMHLADYDDKLVNGRIWTDERHIEQRLADLTEHMEKVIQKYLRNEYATIDEYNARAGEIAEPYRFIVIADFPTGFTDASARRLASIIASGQRCGVYTLIATDVREALPKGIDRADLRASGLTIHCDANAAEVRDEVLGRHRLAVDEPPDEQTLTRIIHGVGSGAADASRVEVPFTMIAPTEAHEWSMDSSSELRIPLGRTGATRLQHLTLGRGTAQHVLIAGKTGSGKSNLLHAIVTSAALWYGPDQVEMYLVDFKKGVEFKIYASGRLPHARAIAIESDREFALSVLQRIDAELRRRGERFREAGVQDLAGFRAARPGEPMPRTLLLIDEFQEFFIQDDSLAQDASLLLDRLVRQGRAFGIHVLLGSQTLAGAYSLARSTMGQMAVRIALQCGEADSYLILGEENGAARLLNRPGEAIYNDAGGAIEANSPFQIVFLPDSVRDAAVARVRKVAQSSRVDAPAPIVFEGNEAADPALNPELAQVLAGLPRVGDRVAWLGDPVAIQSPTAAPMRRQNGSHLLIVGQREDSARGLFGAAMVSLAAQDRPGPKHGGALVYVLDSTPPEAAHAEVLRETAEAIGPRARVGDWSAVESTVGMIGKELDRRRDKHLTDAPPVYLFLFGLHRLRMLKMRDDDFSFSASDTDAPRTPDRALKSIITDGPPYGVHVIAWCDTLTMVERMMERSTVREFGLRALFQMSVTDSTALIDTPAASGLGPNRAIFFSEDEGRIEKFRPYGLPSGEFLDRVRSALR